MNAEVIIIGAGAAGLAAAEALSSQNVKVLVIEARERVGGRIYTVQKNDLLFVELGAEFVHGVPPETFDLAGQAGLELVESAGETWEAGDDEKLHPDRDDDKEENNLWRKLNEYDEAQDVSLRDFLNQTSAKQKACESVEQYVEGFHAAEVEKISVKSLVKTERAANEIEGDRAFRFASGYNSLSDYLHRQCEKRGVEFRLGTIVETVKWQSSAVEVVCQTDSGLRTFTASCAVITLPLGVLQANSDDLGAVRFEPELAGKQAALKQMEMGAARRITLLFKRKWWIEEMPHQKQTEQTLGFLFSRGEPIPVWWTNEPSDAPLLTGWLGGRRAAAMSQHNSNFVLKQAIETLSNIFGVERNFVESELIEFYSYDWQSDSFSRGSYSYVLAGGLDAPGELAAAVENTLFFAGEATNFDGHWGTVHGAIATGKRAAQEILDLLQS